MPRQDKSTEAECPKWVNPGQPGHWREREIVGEIRLNDAAVTLEQLGRRLGISKERVRQIEHRALNKIKQSIVRQSGIGVGREMFDA